ncbi:hypothetical protein GCM10009105_16170 [Dokdonella soli]|uniref:DUF6923 domain-containing protein n=2 Tax=Dokdonella soli TaxID=529810 RepID=A0ABP3TQX5_9GAMM
MLAVASFSANAATTAYGEAFDTLYKIDLVTRQATAIGAAGMYGGVRIGNVSGLTTAADGTLYAVAGGLKLLSKVDPASGRANVLGSLGLAGQGDPARNDALDLSMIVACDGKLYLSSSIANKLWTVDQGTGAATLVGPTGHPITGLVARGGKLYGAGGKGDNNLYRIDPATGAATLIGSFGPGLTRWVNSISMSFDADGTLWAVINYVPPQHDSDPVPDWSDLATINPATGAVTVLGPITGPDSLRQVGMKGFTVGPAQCTGSAIDPTGLPVGSPWALTLLGALLVATGLWSCRNQLRA